MASAVRRDLKVTSPFPHGDDVRALQKAINERLGTRGLYNDKVHVDGVYGVATRHALSVVLWCLGALDNALQQGATTTIQRYVRTPATRPPTWYPRASSRKAAIEQRARGDARDATIKWALSKVGVCEHPAGSNTGPQIDDWQHEFGIARSPWCGAFVGYGLRHVAAIPVPAGVVYTPAILAWARNHQNGFALYPWVQRRKGDLVLFHWPGAADPVQHVGFVVSDATDGHDTVEGNTSSGNGGSQDNGGMVARRTDRDPAFIVGCARPPYGD